MSTLSLAQEVQTFAPQALERLRVLDDLQRLLAIHGFVLPTPAASALAAAPSRWADANAAAQQTGAALQPRLAALAAEMAGQNERLADTAEALRADLMRMAPYDPAAAEPYMALDALAARFVLLQKAAEEASTRALLVAAKVWPHAELTRCREELRLVKERRPVGDTQSPLSLEHPPSFAFPPPTPQSQAFLSPSPLGAVGPCCAHSLFGLRVGGDTVVRLARSTTFARGTQPSQQDRFCAGAHAPRRGRHWEAPQRR